jgi:hypothetical protein
MMYFSHTFRLLRASLQTAQLPCHNGPETLSQQTWEAVFSSILGNKHPKVLGRDREEKARRCKMCLGAFFPCW